MSLLFVGMPGAGTATLAADAGVEEVLLAATEALADQEASGERRGVLVVSPAAHSRSAEIARAVAGRAGIAQVRPTGPTTQLALVAAVLQGHPDLLPTDALAVTGEVLRHVQTHAVLSSVAGLGDPRPSLWQHLTSWAPWTTYRIETPGGAVTSATQPPTAPASFLSSTLDPGTAPRLVADELLAPGPEPLPTLQVPVGDRWGTPRFVERSYLTTSPADIVRTALAVAPRPCPNCDRPTRAARCDFCGVVRSDRKVTA